MNNVPHENLVLVELIKQLGQLATASCKHTYSENTDRNMQFLRDKIDKVMNESTNV